MINDTSDGCYLKLVYNNISMHSYQISHMHGVLYVYNMNLMSNMYTIFHLRLCHQNQIESTYLCHRARANTFQNDIFYMPEVKWPLITGLRVFLSGCQQSGQIAQQQLNIAIRYV